jgi:hypothetical protein
MRSARKTLSKRRRIPAARPSRKNIAKQILASAISGNQPVQKQSQVRVPGINRSIISPSLAPTAPVFTLDPTLDVANWASYAKVYDEFRVISITVIITPVSVTPGLSMFCFDEDDSTSLTNTLAVTKATNVYSNSNVSVPTFHWKNFQMHGYQMHWSASSLTDMDWHDTSSAWQHIYLKAYTDNSFYSTPDETHLFVVRSFYSLSFRGVQ